MKPTASSRAGIDWAAVHAQLARREQAWSGAATADQAEIVLRRRTVEIAAAPATPEAEAMLIPLVRFQLGGQGFALPVSSVRETFRLGPVTPLPGLPAYVRGLTNRRSQVLAVMDIRGLLQVPAASSAAEEFLVVAEHPDADFGFVVEQVDRILATKAITPREMAGLSPKYLAGFADDGTPVLSLATLLPDLTTTA